MKTAHKHLFYDMSILDVTHYRCMAHVPYRTLAYPRNQKILGTWCSCTGVVLT